jgi:hypothetical protein
MVSRRLSVAIAGALGILLAMAPAMAQSIAGRYEVHGTNPNGSSYSGTAQIIQTSPTTCRIDWHVGSEWTGICMLSGDVFAAAYKSGSTSGLLIYHRQPDGMLTGEWTVGAGAGGTETLTPLK